MKLRIDDAILVFNHRRITKGKEAGKNLRVYGKGKKLNSGFLNRRELSFKVFPSDTEHTAYIKTSRLIKDEGCFDPSYIVRIAVICGVDVHFLFGMPSIHDTVYEEATGKRAILNPDYTITYREI